MAERDARGRFLNAPGPGRTKGSTNRVGLLAIVNHLSTLLADAKATNDSLKALRRDDPASFYSLVVKMIPRELLITHFTPLAEPEISEAELLSRMRAIVAKSEEPYPTPPRINHQQTH